MQKRKGLLKMKNLIFLTGGGTAGHVMPNLAILEELKKSGFDPHYVGSSGIEKELATKAGLPFHEIKTGKLRRYFSWQNFVDVFRLGFGFIQALILVMRYKPTVVFSKGGFVAVPITIAAWVFGVPVVTHESDFSPGLANKIITPFSRKILFTFPETAQYLPVEKAVWVGTPVRSELFTGDSEKGKAFCGFEKNQKPVLLVMGGSQGAQRINDALKVVLPELLKTFNVVHLTGRGKQIGFTQEGYKGFEFVGPELKDVFAASDVVVSRAGANSIFELLALKKPMLLIPLEVGSRGDQILNAKSFVKSEWAVTLSEANMTPELFRSTITQLFSDSQKIKERQSSINLQGVPAKIAGILREVSEVG
jgi:UDP-N-acetylglucosamine--N-acetylmuramyl-(pentapeptide) pyrophosphoryl-undecaprenol N-acetylglucosamine transferase